MRFGQRSASTMRSASGRNFLTSQPVNTGASIGLAIGSSQSDADFSKIASPVEVVELIRKWLSGFRRWNSRANFNAIPISPTLTA